MFFVLAAVSGPTPSWLLRSPHFFVFAGGAKTGFARKNGRISALAPLDRGSALYKDTLNHESRSISLIRVCVPCPSLLDAPISNNRVRNNKVVLTNIADSLLVSTHRLNDYVGRLSRLSCLACKPDSPESVGYAPRNLYRAAATAT